MSAPTALSRFLTLLTGCHQPGSRHRDVVVLPTAPPGARVAPPDDTGVVFVPERRVHTVAPTITYAGDPAGGQVTVPGFPSINLVPIRAAEFAPVGGITALTLRTVRDVEYLTALARYVAETGEVPSFLTSGHTVLADLHLLFTPQHEIAAPAVVGGASVSGLDPDGDVLAALDRAPAARRLLAVLAVTRRLRSSGQEFGISGVGRRFFVDASAGEGAHALAAWVLFAQDGEFQAVHLGGRPRFRLSEDSARVLETLQHCGDIASTAARVGCSAQSVAAVLDALGVDLGAPVLAEVA